MLTGRGIGPACGVRVCTNHQSERSMFFWALRISGFYCLLFIGFCFLPCCFPIKRVLSQGWYPLTPNARLNVKHGSGVCMVIARPRRKYIARIGEPPSLRKLEPLLTNWLCLWVRKTREALAPMFSLFFLCLASSWCGLYLYSHVICTITYHNIEVGQRIIVAITFDGVYCTLSCLISAIHDICEEMSSDHRGLLRFPTPFCGTRTPLYRLSD